MGGRTKEIGEENGGEKERILYMSKRMTAQENPTARGIGQKIL